MVLTLLVLISRLAHGFGNAGTGVVVDPNTVSVGEEVAWSWLRTDYSRLHGDFAQNGNYQYWVLTRRFTTYFPDDGTGFYQDGEYTGTYINPLDWQYVFLALFFIRIMKLKS